MGKPENTDDFEVFSIEDITIYIANNVIQEELKGDSLDFYIEGYGKYTFRIIE